MLQQAHGLGHENKHYELTHYRRCRLRFSRIPGQVEDGKKPYPRAARHTVCSSITAKPRNPHSSALTRFNTRMPGYHRASILVFSSNMHHTVQNTLRNVCFLGGKKEKYCRPSLPFHSERHVWHL